MHRLWTAALGLFVVVSLSACGGPVKEDPGSVPPDPVGACVPQTCASLVKNCGAIDDGCGATLQCGSCVGEATCGGGGVPNVCGNEACTRRTCEAAGASCGEIDDGCGATRLCGGCEAPLSCGGGGTPFVCGAQCTTGCPAGYSCTPLGVCRGGDSAALTLNVKTSPVSGRITQNGAPLTGGCNEAVSLYLVNRTNDRLIILPTRCVDEETVWGTELFHGKYSVRVVGSGTAFAPRGWMELTVASNLEITAPRNDLDFDVKTAPISGTVTRNGADVGQPCAGDGTYSPSVFLRSVSGRTGTYLPLACSGAQWTFEGEVPHDSYRAFLVSDGSALPGFEYDFGLVLPQLSVTGAVPNLILDARTSTLSGSITANGDPIGGTCGTGTDLHLVRLQPPGESWSLALPITCTRGNWEFSGEVFEGIFDLDVASDGVVLPGRDYSDVTLARAVRIDQPTVTLPPIDVRTVALNGSVTRDGAPIGAPCNERASLRFSEAATGASWAFPVDCSGTTWSFSARLAAGTYQVVFLSDDAVLTGTQEFEVPISSSFDASIDRGDVAFDLPTIRLSGSLTHKGAPMGAPCTYPPAIHLTEVTSRRTQTVGISCDTNDWTFDARIFPGTYRVQLRSDQGVLPPGYSFFEIRRSLSLIADSLGNVFDVRTSRFAGRLTRNGAEVGVPCSDFAAALNFGSGDGTSTKVPLSCSTGEWTFDTQVFSGTQEVLLQSDSAGVPGGDGISFHVLVDRLEVP